MKKFKLIKEALRIADAKIGIKDGFHYIMIHRDCSGRIISNHIRPYDAKAVVIFNNEEDMIEKLREYVKTNGFDEYPK